MIGKSQTIGTEFMLKRLQRVLIVKSFKVQERYLDEHTYSKPDGGIRMRCAKKPLQKAMAEAIATRSENE